MQKWKPSRQVRAPDGQRDVGEPGATTFQKWLGAQGWFCTFFSLPGIKAALSGELAELTPTAPEISGTPGPYCPNIPVPATVRCPCQTQELWAIQCGTDLLESSVARGSSHKAAHTFPDGGVRDALCRKSQVGWALEDRVLPLKLYPRKGIVCLKDEQTRTVKFIPLQIKLACFSDIFLLLLRKWYWRY